MSATNSRPNNKPPNTDSLAVATTLIRNAKQIHLDLIKGDWAIKREVIYKAQISEQEAINQRQAGQIATLTKSNGNLSAELTENRQKLGEQTLETKKARLEIWAMRVAIGLYVAGKIKGLLP